MHAQSVSTNLNEYHLRLGSKHAMHKPRIHGLTAKAGVWLRAREMQISTAQWANVAWEGLYLTLRHNASIIQLYHTMQFLWHLLRGRAI